MSMRRDDSNAALGRCLPVFDSPRAYVLFQFFGIPTRTATLQSNQSKE